MSVQLVAPPGATEFIGLSGTAYTVNANGVIAVNAGDISAALNAGWRYGISGLSEYAVAAPAAAETTSAFAAVTLQNGSLNIAGQPDFPRKTQQRYALSAGTVTEGSLTVVGVTNRGQTVTEVDSLVGIHGTGTLTSSLAYGHITSMVVGGLGGNSTGTWSGGAASALGLPLASGAVGLAVFKETVDDADEAVGTVDTVAGTVIPTTAPNGTHSFAFGYTFINPAG